MCPMMSRVREQGEKYRVTVNFIGKVVLTIGCTNNVRWQFTHNFFFYYPASLLFTSIHVYQKVGGILSQRQRCQHKT